MTSQSKAQALRSTDRGATLQLEPIATKEPEHQSTDPQLKSSSVKHSGTPFVVLVCEQDEIRDDVGLIVALSGARMVVYQQWADVSESEQEQSVALVFTSTTPPERVITGAPLVLIDVDVARLWSVAAQYPGAFPVPLPHGRGWFSEFLRREVQGRNTGEVIAVASGYGGAGATTVAYVLAAEYTARGAQAALVDLNPGPLSPIEGLLQRSGKRDISALEQLNWEKLRTIKGRLSPAHLLEAIPQVDGITMLSGTEPAQSIAQIDAATIHAVAQECDVVVVDVGQQLDSLKRLEGDIYRVVVVADASPRGAQAVTAVREAASHIRSENICSVICGKAAPGWDAIEVNNASRVKVAATLRLSSYVSRSGTLEASYELLRNRRAAKQIRSLLNALEWTPASVESN